MDSIKFSATRDEMSVREATTEAVAVVDGAVVVRERGEVVAGVTVVALVVEVVLAEARSRRSLLRNRWTGTISGCLSLYRSRAIVHHSIAAL
jgi:hypothetical protein